MKNKLFIILFSILLLQSTVVAEESNISLPPVNTEIMETVDNPDSTDPAHIAVNDDEVSPIKNPNIPHKQPTGKKKILKKFLMAMLAVAGSSLLIFAGLSIYNSYRSNFKFEFDNNSRENMLDEPENLNDAIKSFLEKTKWE